MMIIAGSAQTSLFSQFGPWMPSQPRAMFSNPPSGLKMYNQRMAMAMLLRPEGLKKMVRQI